MRATERRMAILEALCKRRHDSVENLANEFNVSVRTIKYDIEALILSYPVYTTQGCGGGVHVVDGYYIGRKYLKPSQEALLQKLKKSLEGVDIRTMEEILKTFALPLTRKEG
ncbi:MAG: HTH domain-containing protein [Christensenellales bacterium]|jgi:predicted DNA-binding transcriptional regulator YafY